MGVGLPDIEPGALPALVRLELALISYGTRFQPSLPASWGAGADVLPSLRELLLDLAIAGPLPEAWASGFRSLEWLRISGEFGVHKVAACHQAASATASQPARHLPAAWAAGFRRLDTLQLSCLGIGGPLPAAWSSPGSFPSLTQL